jgi:phosphoglycerate dehydrogenase-like enzyme
MPSPAKLQVAVLDDYQNVALDYADWRTIEDRCQVTVFRDTVAYSEELVERLRPFDVLCLMRERTPLPRALIDRLPALKLVVTTAGHNHAIDGAALRERGIPLCGTTAATNPTVELTWTLILALARNLVDESLNMREGRWQTTVGTDLRGATLGIAGLGKLGSEIARVASAFGMRVIAWSRNLTDERAAAGGAQRVSKAELFEQSDFLTVHLKLSPESVGIIGAEDLGRMKPSAYFINTSRGPLVDQDALVNVLRQGRIAGAAVDVYDIEPPPGDHVLRTLDRLLATPHLGYVTKDNYKRFYRDTVEDIRAWLDGTPVRLIE